MTAKQRSDAALIRMAANHVYARGIDDFARLAKLILDRDLRVGTDKSIRELPRYSQPCNLAWAVSHLNVEQI